MAKSGGAKIAAPKPVVAESKKNARSASKGPSKDSGKKAVAKDSSKLGLKRSATEPKASMAG